MSEPLVSVLLPVRDAGPYLKDCIASLDRQTLENFEVIAVDDGSTDGSAEALDEWAARDDRGGSAGTMPTRVRPAPTAWRG